MHSSPACSPAYFSAGIIYANATRRFRYVVSNSVHGGNFVAGSWQTDALPAGDYTVRIFASDYAGNTVVKNRDLVITLRQFEKPAP